MKNRKFRQNPNRKRKGNYQQVIEALGKTGAFGVGLNHVTVRHDNNCQFFQGGVCNCNPIVTPGQPDDPGQTFALEFGEVDPEE